MAGDYSIASEARGLDFVDLTASRAAVSSTLVAELAKIPEVSAAAAVGAEGMEIRID
jgi:hypothetical protein